MERPRVSVVRRVAFVLVTVTMLVTPAPLAAATPRHTLAQTVEPPFGSVLTRRMAVLFHDIVGDSLASAERLFFPESAYVAMKTGRIAAPASDYQFRLIAFFSLDLAAYRTHVLANGPATFMGVNSNPRDAQWIQPGWCENSIGYWYLPRTRLVYRTKGVVRSVAVASLISWRGVWYVVHLGPNPRPRNVGTVDLPSLGRGIAGPAGGC